MNQISEINGYNGKYLVYRDGRVWSHLSKKFLKPQKYKSGYFYVAISGSDSRSKKHKIHRLVALAFVPNPKNNPEVNHKDGRKHNNHASNLEWVSRSENIRHAFASGLSSQRGDRHAGHKLTSEKVLEVMRLTASGWKRCDIAAKYQVKPTTISMIISGRNWSHVTGLKMQMKGRE